MSRLFEPNETVTRWAVGFSRALAMAQVPVLVLRLIQAGSGNPNMAAGLAGALGGLVGLVGIIGGVLVLVWTYQAYGNLAQLGNDEPTLSTGWVVAGFLIPGLSMVLPYVALRELWQSSDPNLAPANREGRRTVPVPNAIHLFGAANFVPGLYTLLTLARISFFTREEIVFGPGRSWLLWAVVLNTAASILGSFLAAEIIKELQERQVARWYALEARRGSP